MVAGADVVTHFRHAAWVRPTSFAFFATDGRLVAILVHDETSRVMRPPSGLDWATRPPGYAVGSSSVPKSESILSVIKTTRDRATGALQWSVTTVRLVWGWAVLLGAGMVGLVLTRRTRAGLCTACGYPLAGLSAETTRCPECGGPIAQPAGRRSE